MKQRRYTRRRMALDGHAKAKGKSGAHALPRVAHARPMALAAGAVTIACAIGMVDALLRKHMVDAVVFGSAAALCLFLAVAYARA